MKSFAIIVFAVASLSVWAQDQRQCNAKFDELLKEMVSLNQSYAGSVQYKDINQTFMLCAQSGKCGGKPEALIGLLEVMVDDEVISIQRKKVGVMKSFFMRGKEFGNDACRAINAFPPVLDQIKILNNAQLDRMSAFAKEYVNQRMKAH